MSKPKLQHKRTFNVCPNPNYNIKTLLMYICPKKEKNQALTIHFNCSFCLLLSLIGKQLHMLPLFPISPTLQFSNLVAPNPFIFFTNRFAIWLSLSLTHIAPTCHTHLSHIFLYLQHHFYIDPIAIFLFFNFSLLIIINFLSLLFFYYTMLGLQELNHTLNIR